MASRVTVRRSETSEVAVFLASEGDNTRVADESEIARRFDLNVGQFDIYEELSDGVSISALSKGLGPDRVWFLRCGKSYNISVLVAQGRMQDESTDLRMGLASTPSADLGEVLRDAAKSPSTSMETDGRLLRAEIKEGLKDGDAPRVTPLEDCRTPPDNTAELGSVSPPGTSSSLGDPLRDLEGRTKPPASVLGAWDDEFLVSVPHSMLHGKGSSRCVVAARRILKVRNPERVEQLPPEYDGDRVFEFPPYTGSYFKGAFFLGMERKNDCFMWSKMIETNAMIGAKLNNNKNAYKISMVKCLGSLECLQKDCQSFLQRGVRNRTNWTRDRAGRNELPFLEGEDVPQESVLCSFCERPPRCVAKCPAEMWFVTPAPSDENYKHKSCVAMHVGNHTHLPMFKHCNYQRSVVRNLMEEQVKRSPHGSPSFIKSGTIKALHKIFEDKVAKSLTREEADDLDETLAILSDKSLFRSMVQSIKKYTQTSSDLEKLIELRNSTVFPFVQSILFPGQGVSTAERPHIFKMSTKGPGSGVDLVRRMQKDGDLENSWVMSDVMHRCLDRNWCTMSAHVYDHLYRGLCTIFVCKLASEDTAALQTAWTVMRRICAENGIQNVKFCGFIADNAAAGWNAIRNEWWDGKVNEQRERLDSFHWAQSVERVKNLISPAKRFEHKQLLESLRHAGNIIEAYRTFEKIKTWWSQGNALPGKVMELTTWMSWWIVRFAQWGNFIRLVSFSSIRDIV